MDALLANTTGISLKCVLKCPAGLDCSQLTGDVYWYTTSNQLALKQTILLYDQTNRQLYSFVEEVDWTPKINHFVGSVQHGVKSVLNKSI
jgi:hypothetical protein